MKKNHLQIIDRIAFTLFAGLLIVAFANSSQPNEQLAMKTILCFSVFLLGRYTYYQLFIQNHSAVLK